LANDFIFLNVVDNCQGNGLALLDIEVLFGHIIDVTRPKVWLQGI